MRKVRFGTDFIVCEARTESPFALGSLRGNDKIWSQEIVDKWCLSHLSRNCKEKRVYQRS